MKPAIHILLVEDNDGDELLITEAFKELKITNKISVLRDGKAAIDFLNEAGNNKKSDLPNIILLDINLPKKNGHDVLQHIKNADNLKQIPVIMLTSSSSGKDINNSYKNYANCYITKPLEAAGFIKTVEVIKKFWMNTVTLPN